MLGVGLILSILVLGKRLRAIGIDTAIGSTVTLLAIIFGVVGSKLRRDSTSSPKNSARTGRSRAGENTSTMPPRALHCPTSTTLSTRS